MATNEPVVLGSGRLYTSNLEDIENATEEEIEASLVELGVIESGATLTYEPTVEQFRGGKNNRIIQSYITQEDLTFSSGIMTWNLEGLKLLAPGNYTEETDATSGMDTKTLKVGGQYMPNVSYLRFVHDKRYEEGQIVVNIAKAESISGMELTFDNSEKTTTNYEFTSRGDKDGTLVEIVETSPTPAA